MSDYDTQIPDQDMRTRDLPDVSYPTKQPKPSFLERLDPRPLVDPNVYEPAFQRGWEAAKNVDLAPGAVLRGARAYLNPPQPAGPPRVYEPLTEEKTEEAPQAAPKRQAIGGGGGLSAGGTSQFERQMAADYDEQLRGMQAEMEARGKLSEGQAAGMTRLSQLQAENARQMQAEAQEAAAQHRAHLDAIGQLSQAYAEGQIDKDLWWKQKNTGQRIATVLGAMFAGIAGGPKTAMEFINGQIDRSIAIQKDEMERQRHAIGTATNLFEQSMAVTKNEQAANALARAAMTDSAMSEVAASTEGLKGAVELGQRQQLMAALKMQRDTFLARLAAARQAASAAAHQQQGALEVDPHRTATDGNGQSYLINNPAMGDDVTNGLFALKNIHNLVARGQALLEARSKINPLTHPLDYKDNLLEGKSIDGFMQESISKLANARGLPGNIAETVKTQLPEYSSPFASFSKIKGDQTLDMIQQRSQEVLRMNGARPIILYDGPGHGKESYKSVPYAIPGYSTPQAAAQKDEKQFQTFKPDQQ